MLSGQGRLFLGDSERLCSLANASETGISVTFVYYALGNRFRRLMGTATRIQLGITAFIARYRHRSSLFETREAPVSCYMAVYCELQIFNTRRQT